MDALKKIVIATENLVFDFELFIGGRCRKKGFAILSNYQSFRRAQSERFKEQKNPEKYNH